MALPAFATCLVTVIALTGAFPDNVDTLHMEALMEIGTHRHLQALMSNMTVHAAMAHPPSMPAELQALVKQRLGVEHGMESSHVFLQAHTSKAKLGAMTVDESRVVLNRLAKDAMAKLDLQRATCQSQQAKQQQLLSETGQDIASFNAQGTSARAAVMATQTAIKRLQDMIPKLNNELSLHEAKCQESRLNLKQQIAIIKQDSATLEQVSKQSGCSSLLQAGVVKCRTHNGTQVAAFKHPTLRKKAAQLKSPTARRAMQTVLLEVATQHRHHHHRERHHREHEGKHHRRHRHKERDHRRDQRRQERHRRHKHVALLAQSERTRSVGSEQTKLPAWQEPLAKAATAMCKLRSNPDCNTVSDKLMNMQANVLDDIASHESQLSCSEDDCKATKKSIQDELKAAQTRLAEQQEALAETTTTVISAQEQSRIKGAQMDHLEAEHQRLDSFCQDTVGQVALQLAQYKAIRQELYKMEQQRPFIQDCEVSAWTPGECDKSCGGGVQNLVRQVVVPDAMGAACPPLTMQRSCNSQDCPIDCSMGEWSGWTSCSAKCGGGIKQRIRHVNQRARHGGKVCGAESESVGCGMAACDKDCELAAWTGWTACSKACGGGFQERARHISIPSAGLGKCAADDSEERLQYKRCNMDKCVPKTPPLLKCAAKVDVILLIDGSGSLGQAGFDAVKAASAKLLTAMDPNANEGNGAQVAVLMYSGPKNMEAYKKCTTASAEAPADLAADCKMSWVSHFTTNNAQIAAGVGSLIWQKGSTMTSQALASAEAELIYGRADAQQVVVAIADRLPMMPKRTEEAAASLRKKARLIWAAAAGPSELQKFASWASRPAADNVIHMKTIEELNSDAMLNKLISTVCPKVE
jgi:hypothetical protein